MSDSPLIGKTVEISVMLDVISINVHCNSDYEAQVFFDDITERLDKGDHITIEIGDQSKAKP